MRGRVALCCLMFLPVVGMAQSRPNLVLTAEEARAIRSSLDKLPVFDRSFHEARATVEQALGRPIDVPVPKDAGGSTHERHKRNYTEMHLAGVLYAVAGDERYARFVRDMLLQYARLYPALGTHPKASGEAAGRLFWQTLNETVWLVHTAQAYDCVYDWLKPEERKAIEENIFRPMARFFTVDHATEHDRIHNHGTWTVTAVGMLGYALRDRELVTMAIYGTKKDGSGGFLRQIDQLFSPDGFYTEGAYYVRYALMPFFLFAQAIDNNQPELGIFKYRNGILGKALYSALQLTPPSGAFIPINDALKEKNFLSPEIIVALDITYQKYGRDPSLLGIAARHDRVMLNGAGLEVARGLASTRPLPDFVRKSLEFTDGARGDHGGVGILRAGPLSDQVLLLMKYTGHGLSHGHYDKLSCLLYDGEAEILQDYGAARFINVEPKNGGRYLRETKSFAMQTIAHNTVAVDGKSHYGGDITISEQRHADRHFFSVSDSAFQVMSARCSTAYEGVQMQRTMALIRDGAVQKPVVVDLFCVRSSTPHTWDLPFYYMGHLMFTNAAYDAHDTLQTRLGPAHGYQHLWNEAEGSAASGLQFSWLNGSRYYTVTSSAEPGTRVIFARIGATDPDFNLRNERAVIQRRVGAQTVFASTLEMHGAWDPVREYSSGARGRITGVTVLASTQEATLVEITGEQNLRWVVMVSSLPSEPGRKHRVTVGERRFEWTGDAAVQKF